MCHKNKQDENDKYGWFEHDKPEKILGVIEIVGKREFKMKVRWKINEATGKRPRSSIYTNTVLKEACPDLLFDFYEDNIENTC